MSLLKSRSRTRNLLEFTANAKYTYNDAFLEREKIVAFHSAERLISNHVISLRAGQSGRSPARAFAHATAG